MNKVTVMDSYKYRVEMPTPTILKDDGKLDTERFKWCKKYCTGNFTTDMKQNDQSLVPGFPAFSYYYCFENEADALLFALTWK